MESESKLFATVIKTRGECHVQNLIVYSYLCLMLIFANAQTNTQHSYTVNKNP